MCCFSFYVFFDFLVFSDQDFFCAVCVKFFFPFCFVNTFFYILLLIFFRRLYFKNSLNASKPSEHPRGENVKMFGREYSLPRRYHVGKTRFSSAIKKLTGDDMVITVAVTMTDVVTATTTVASAPTTVAAMTVTA